MRITYDFIRVCKPCPVSLRDSHGAAVAHEMHQGSEAKGGKGPLQVSKGPFPHPAILCAPTEMFWKVFLGAAQLFINSQAAVQ